MARSNSFAALCAALRHSLIAWCACGLLQALHDPQARNKTFEVCYEYTPEEGLEMYELVAHLPDKSNNYLSPALATLEKNT
jgi:hypothetical protein